MRSVWICSRNDAIGNLAVIAAALGVFGTGTGWPDIIVAGIMATLGITGGAQIIRQARAELRMERSSTTIVAPAG
jgi:Co/Zn/Cd efflux system component